MQDDLSLTDVEQLVRQEAATLEPDVSAIYERFAVAPVRMLYSWAMNGRVVSKPVWVIARDGPNVIGYDEVEEDYGTGVVRREGVVENWGTYGERLRWALIRFPDDPFGGPRLGDAQPIA